MLQEVTNHRKDRPEIQISDLMISSQNGNMVPKKTKRGWDLLVELKNGSSRWIPLEYLKASNPVEQAKCAAGNRLYIDSAFKWWVRAALRRRNRKIAKVKSKYWHMKHKFGIRVPKYVDEALAIDKENGNTLWYTAIQKKMKNVRIYFEAWDEGSLYNTRSGQKLVGYEEVRCHIIFDINMDGQFTR